MTRAVTACPHCDAPVIECVFRGTGRVILLDPEPLAIGNLHFVHDAGPWIEFVPPERRKETARRFVPPEQRYQSHFVTCPAHCRSGVEART